MAASKINASTGASPDPALAARAALTERLLGELAGLSHHDMDGALAWLSGYVPEAVEKALASLTREKEGEPT
jgi:ribosomal protein S12 methylthiotransferase accessory factor YcaO